MLVETSTLHRLKPTTTCWSYIGIGTSLRCRHAACRRGDPIPEAALELELESDSDADDQEFVRHSRCRSCVYAWWGLQKNGSRRSAQWFTFLKVCCDRAVDKYKDGSEQFEIDSWRLCVCVCLLFGHRSRCRSVSYWKINDLLETRVVLVTVCYIHSALGLWHRRHLVVWNETKE